MSTKNLDQISQVPKESLDEYLIFPRGVFMPHSIISEQIVVKRIETPSGPNPVVPNDPELTVHNSDKGVYSFFAKGSCMWGDRRKARHDKVKGKICYWRGA